MSAEVEVCGAILAIHAFSHSRILSRNPGPELLAPIVHFPTSRNSRNSRNSRILVSR